jgi:hypothetical protein
MWQDEGEHRRILPMKVHSTSDVNSKVDCVLTQQRARADEDPAALGGELGSDF